MTTTSPLPALPLARLLGIQIDRAEPDCIVATMTVRDDLCTVGGMLHGGALMALADTVGAIGASLNLRDGQRTTTIESKTNFIGAAAAGMTLSAEARPVHIGRRTSVWQTRVASDAGKLIGIVTQTQMVLD